MFLLNKIAENQVILYLLVTSALGATTMDYYQSTSTNISNVSVIENNSNKNVNEQSNVLLRNNNTDKQQLTLEETANDIRFEMQHFLATTPKIVIPSTKPPSRYVYTKWQCFI